MTALLCRKGPSLGWQLSGDREEGRVEESQRAASFVVFAFFFFLLVYVVGALFKITLSIFSLHAKY